jgi:hypothetical protein
MIVSMENRIIFLFVGTHNTNNHLFAELGSGHKFRWSAALSVFEHVRVFCSTSCVVINKRPCFYCRGLYPSCFLRSCDRASWHVTVHRDMWPCIMTNFLIIKPTRCTNFSNLFWKWNSTCFGQFCCPSSGVIHCTLSSGICHTVL